jgi:glucosamine-6-phosphate deaminase
MSRHESTKIPSVPPALIVLPSAEAVCQHAADLVAETLAAKPDAVLALPAGNTPRPIYAELVRRHRAGGLSFARASAFALDEYVGLPADHPASFRRFIRDQLIDRVDLPAGRFDGPDGQAANLAFECDRYERAIAGAGGLDLALLGIGANGHVAFNEPPAPPASRTRVVALAVGSRSAAAASFGGDPVPVEALTMGIATILAARRCVLVATGAGKADAISRMLTQPPTPALPASALQLHQDATVVVDRAAASGLTP